MEVTITARGGQLDVACTLSSLAGRNRTSGTSADLPDAPVRLGPAGRDHLDGAAEQRPERRGDLAAVAVVEPGRVEQVAVRVERELRGRSVADPQWARAAPAIELAKLQLGQQPLAA